MVKNTPPMVVTDTGLTIFLNGEVVTAPSDHANYAKVVDAIAAGDFDAIKGLLNLRDAVVNFVNGANRSGFVMHGDLLCLDGKPFTFAVTEKVLDMIEAGQPADPIYNFLRKTRQNPRVAAQDELLLFCVANNFMIHEDGDILAYKSVRGDYKDIHSGTIRNAVGDVVTMDRKAVDDDRDRTCSTGLHFASYEYASTWAGNIDGKNRRLMVMKINPADVVAIPSDYNNQKGRCWKYTVIAEIGNSPLARKVVYSDADLGVTRSTDLRDVAPVKPAKDKTAEIARKNAIRDKWIARRNEIDGLLSELDEREANIEDLNDRINQIEELGGSAHDLRDELEAIESNAPAHEDWELEEERDKLDALIDRIDCEIARLR